jgi:hypothetical protein
MSVSSYTIELEPNVLLLEYTGYWLQAKDTAEVNSKLPSH